MRKKGGKCRFISFPFPFKWQREEQFYERLNLIRANYIRFWVSLFNPIKSNADDENACEMKLFNNIVDGAPFLMTVRSILVHSVALALSFFLSKTTKTSELNVSFLL